jgi:MinD-like ATPase involved in chromosome partitioning or flagellar assembly
MPSPDRGREFVLPLSLSGIRVRMVVQSGNQLIAEVGREPAECILLPEALPDGPAEMWLAKAAAVAPRRPLAVVLVYGVEASESVRERVRAAYGPAVEVVAAGARNVNEVAAETARVLDRLARTLAEQDHDAFERLSRPVPPGTIPQPVRKGGAVAFAGASGGVGTSTLVVNLATYAATAGQRVLIVDAQFPTAGSILHYFGLQPDDQNHGMHHLRWTHMGAGGAVRDGAADELMQRLAEVRLRTVRHADIKVLSVPALLEPMLNLPAEQLTWAIQVLERSFDLVLVDCGTGVGTVRTQALLQQAARVYLVTGGWGVSVHGLTRQLAALEGRPELERIFLLLREAPEGVYGVRTVRSVVNMPIYGRMPDEPLLRKAETRLGAGLPLVAEAPDSPYSRSIAELAFSLGLVDQVERKARDVRSGKGWLHLGFGKG